MDFLTVSFDPNLFKATSQNPLRSFENESWFIKPPHVPDYDEHELFYEKAAAMARGIQIQPGHASYHYLSGNFEFGDFIEALFVEHNYHTGRLLISTLSMSQNNVDSLASLLNGGFVDNLDLVISAYQFAHERHGLIPYIYETLGAESGRFQLAVAASHCKLCLFTTDEGLNIGIRGSANLRSSACIEHFFIHESKELNQADEATQNRIIERFKTIKKPLRRNTAWRAATGQSDSVSP